MAILVTGILPQGNGFQEFSHYDGFYLSTDLDDAWKWAIKRAQIRQRAILVYCVSQSTLDALGQAYVVFPSKGEKKFVNENRTGILTPKKLYEGPVCANPSAVTTGAPLQTH